MSNPFIFHAPGPKAQEEMATLRSQFAALWAGISYLPDSREKSLALTNLQQASMWANLAAVKADPESKPA